MQCPRCLNTNPIWFYKGSRGWYCRRCIRFGRTMLEETKAPVSLSELSASLAPYQLSYPLTAMQKTIAQQVAVQIMRRDVLLQAVCGAGKTEMVVETISAALRRKKRIGFAIARRTVVLELAERLQTIFTKARVIPVCGGYTAVTDGDLIICTTHQLFRYYQAFDILILDEPDAFPFRGNRVLYGIAATACRGHCLYLTATPDARLSARVKNGSLIRYRLDQRPHGHPLPVPGLLIRPLPLLLVHLAYWLKRNADKRCLVFAPTIRWVKILYFIFRRQTVACHHVTSRTVHSEMILQRFKDSDHGVLFATTILERGVTIPDVSVCVFLSDHPVFDRAGLVQMAGRAGRTFQAPDGDVLFLSHRPNDPVNRCIADIKEANACAACYAEKTI
ncbi:MAG: helicase-related protein [Bulleidia sp.]